MSRERPALAKYSIKAQFDVDMSDFSPARAVAKKHLMRIVSQTLNQGGRIETGAATPEAGIDMTLEIHEPSLA